MKAIVVETRKKEAAVLLKDGTFRVVKGEYKVGDTIVYREKKPLPSRRWMAAAAALVLMLGTGGGFWYDANYVAYAEISLDVNPSIVYTVSKRCRVLEVKAVNDEAAGIVSTLERAGIRFMPVSEAIEKTMSICEEEGYTDSEHEDYVLMNISADNNPLQERLTSEIETGMEHAMEHDTSMEFRVDHSDRATARRASENHMSTGRYAIWEQEGGEKAPEEYAEMPIREVMGKPSEAVPAPPEESDKPVTDRETLPDPADGSQERTVPESSEIKPSDKDDSLGSQNKTEEPNDQFTEHEQGLPQSILPDEPGSDQEASAPSDNKTQRPDIPEETPGKSQDVTNQPPSGQQPNSESSPGGSKPDIHQGEKGGQGPQGNTQGSPENQPRK